APYGGLLVDLAHRGGGRLLPGLRDAGEHRPLVVVRALSQQNSALVVEDDRADAGEPQQLVARGGPDRADEGRSSHGIDPNGLLRAPPSASPGRRRVYGYGPPSAGTGSRTRSPSRARPRRPAPAPFRAGCPSGSRASRRYAAGPSGPGRRARTCRSSG